MSALRNILAVNAKAVTALIVGAVTGLAASHSIAIDNDAVASVVGSLVTAAIVWLVPNTPR